MGTALIFWPCAALRRRPPSQRSRAAESARRIAALETASTEAAALRTRVAALERSLAIVREVANGDAAPPLRSPPANTAAGAGGLQSALSGFQQAPPAATGAQPGAPSAVPVDATPGNEMDMVVDSGGRGRKRGRPPAAAARRPAAPARDSSPEPQVLRPPLPPPLSPILPRRVDMDPLPPPLSPLRPPAVVPLAQPAERRAPAAAPKRPTPAAKPKKAAPTVPPADAALGRPGALPLGKGRGKAAPPPAPPPVAVPLPEPVPELSPAEAEAEAAGASVTSEVGVRGVLHDAARSGPATTAAAARGMAAATLTRNVSPAALLAGITSALRTEAACADPALPAAVLQLDAALARAREGGRGGAVRLLGSGAVGGFADAVGAALHSCALEAAAGRGGGAAPGPAACATVALLRARGLQDAARVFLLDLLSLGRAAGGASAALAAAVQGALQAWPGLLSGTDPLVVAAAAVASHILRDQAADSLPPLEPHLAGASVADAKQLAVEWLLRCSGDDADRDALHCAVRGLELLASHCGALRLGLRECA